MNGPPYREFMLWGICMIVPSRGFRSSMRNPRKNTLSCRTIMKLLSSTPLSKRFFLPHGRQNEIVIPSVCEESPRLFYRLRFFTSHCSVQNDMHFAGDSSFYFVSFRMTLFRRVVTFTEDSFFLTAVRMDHFSLRTRRRNSWETSAFLWSSFGDL